MTPQPAPSRADFLAALQLYAEWGVDEALSEEALDRFGEALRCLPEKILPPRVSIHSAENPLPRLPAPSGGGAIEAAQNLAELVAASQVVEGVFLARTAMNRLEPVCMQGAPFMLIGEVPDADEDRSGVLFSGRAGDLLVKMLASIGVQREALSLAPAVPWRPPGGRGVTEQEMLACRPILLKTIELCRPRVLVTMGTTPMKMLLGEDLVLNRVRGKWGEITVAGGGAAIPVLPMRHPLQLAASPMARRNAWQDLLTLEVFLEEKILDSNGTI